MKLKVYAEAPNQYRAILENPNHVAGMVFSSHDDLIAFIVEMPITYVVVMINLQGNVAYGYRLDSEELKTAVAFYQSGKKGRKRVIYFGNE
jgi:hypothetical protein